MCLIYCKYTGQLYYIRGEAEAEVGRRYCTMARSQSLIILIFPRKPEVPILDDNFIQNSKVKLQHGKFYVGFSFVRSIKLTSCKFIHIRGKLLGICKEDFSLTL